MNFSRILQTHLTFTALCNAHHLRELKVLVEHDEEAWAAEISDFLLMLKELVDPVPNKTMPELTSSFFEPFEHYYDCLIDDGLKFHEALTSLNRQSKTDRPKLRPDHNLLRQLRASRRMCCALPETLPCRALHRQSGRAGHPYDKK